MGKNAQVHGVPLHFETMTPELSSCLAWACETAYGFYPEKGYHSIRLGTPDLELAELFVSDIRKVFNRLPSITTHFSTQHQKLIFDVNFCTRNAIVALRHFTDWGCDTWGLKGEYFANNTPDTDRAYLRRLFDCEGSANVYTWFDKKSKKYRSRPLIRLTNKNIVSLRKVGSMLGNIGIEYFLKPEYCIRNSIRFDWWNLTVRRCSMEQFIRLVNFDLKRKRANTVKIMEWLSTHSQYNPALRVIKTETNRGLVRQ